MTRTLIFRQSLIGGFDDLTSKEYGRSFLATTTGWEGLLASLRITSRLQKEGSIGNRDTITEPWRRTHISRPPFHGAASSKRR